MDALSSSATPRAEPTSERALAQRLRKAVSARLHDESLVKRGGWLQVRCLVGIGSEALLLTVDRGKLSLHEQQPPLASWDFAVRGTARAWHQFWQSPPLPGWHDLFALAKRGELRLEGNLQPLMANLQYFKDLLALPRAAVDS